MKLKKTIFTGFNNLLGTHHISKCEAHAVKDTQKDRLKGKHKVKYLQ